MRTCRGALTRPPGAERRFDVPDVPGTGLDRLGAMVEAHLRNLRARRPATGASCCCGPSRWPPTADADPDAVAVLLLAVLRGIGMQQASPAGAPVDDFLADQVVGVLRRGLATG